MVMVSSNEMLVNGESTSRLFMHNLLSCWTIFLANEKETFTVNLLIVKQLSVVTKNFANVYVDVPFADNKGLKCGEISTIALWILQNTRSRCNCFDFLNTD